MLFNDRLAAAAKLTETHLASLLGAQARSAVPTRLSDAMRHAVLGGGKRLRPFLVLESARLFNADPAAALDVAAALECIHCYSLVHDDLPAMDNDRLRRGQPTVWAAFDDWTAILAGDALLTFAFEIIATSARGIAPPAAVRVIAALARASGAAGMVGGQAMDLAAAKLAPKATHPEMAIGAMQGLKTGALIGFAAEAGALLVDAPEAERAALVAYGHHLGAAFQIADDLLDAEGDAAIVGKAVAKDAAAGKATLVGLLGIEAARRRLAVAEAAAIAALSPFGARAETLREAAHFVATRKN